MYIVSMITYIYIIQETVFALDQALASKMWEDRNGNTHEDSAMSPKKVTPIKYWYTLCCKCLLNGC